MSLKATLEEFFARYSGKLVFINEISRENFERFPQPGDGKIRALTAHVSFSNKAIFGRQGDYLEDIFPCVNFLTNKLRKCLDICGFPVTGKEATLNVSIAPYVDPDGEIDSPLPQENHHSRGKDIIPIEKLRDGSYYYKALAEKYFIGYGVVTNNNTVIGPDGGLIASACAVASTFDRKLKVLELGTGGGATALSLLGKNKLASYMGNDFSPEMTELFEYQIKPRLETSNVDASFQQGSCLDISLGNSMDLVSVGVYYQAQPSLFAKRGKEIASCLGKSGLLIAQTGMLEDAFISSLLLQKNSLNAKWPWYDSDYCVHNYFQYVAELNVEEEKILIATNNYARFTETIKALNRISNILNMY